MTFDAADVRVRIQLGEDALWEFKEVAFRGNRLAGPRPDALADELAAFANGRGGVLLLGVTDAGQVQELTRAQLDSLETAVVDLRRNKIKPPVEVEIRRFLIEPGKPILSVEVEPGYAQHDSPGGAYRRIGSSKRRMSSDERLRLAQSRSQARCLWFDEQPVPGTGFGTLDEALWKPMLDAEGRLEPKRALTKLALLASEAQGDVKATVAGVLLCSRAPEGWLPNATITATHFRGQDRAAPQLDEQVITGPLHRQVADAMKFVQRNMRVGAHKSPARMDLPQYSLEAVFEGMVNAVAHRDYTIRGSRIRLSMFSDRLEINAPGGLPNNLTIADMPARQSTRNEAIVSVLARLPVGGIPGSQNRAFFMEQRGTGVPVILRETLSLSGRSPEYQLLGDSDLFLTLPAAETVATPGQVTVSVRDEEGPIAGADVLALYPSGSWQRETTDEQGHVRFDFWSKTRPMVVFVAAPGNFAHLERDWIPARGDLEVTLRRVSDGGSVILALPTDRVPGLDGKLSPQRGAHDRTFLYTDHMPINEGQPQPVHFTPREELRITGLHGVSVMVRIMEILGGAALVEYRAAPPDG